VKDERKTKKELIAELEKLRGEVGELRQQLADADDQSKIELALDVVRSATAAMGSSEDLSTVVAALYRSLEKLSIRTDGVGINIFDEENEILRRNVYHLDGVGQLVSMKDEISFRDDIFIEDLYTHWKQGVVYHRLATRETLREAIEAAEVEPLRRHLATEGVDTRSDDDSDVRIRALKYLDQKFDENRSHWIVDISYAQGTLAMAREGSTFSDREIGILTRMTEVFAPAYLRFLDFQKLEQQAEQAQRERAVERVRAEAMAMRGSYDITKVVAVLHQELHNMGIDSLQTSIVVMDEEKGTRTDYTAKENPHLFDVSWSTPDWIEYDENIIVGILEQSSIDYDSDIVKYWRNGETSVREKVYESNSLEDKLRLAELIKSRLGLSGNYDSYWDSTWDRMVGADVVNVPFKYGVIGFFRKTQNKEDEVIVQELAAGFSLGYLRFLDFQKLEAELEKAHDLQMGLMPTEPPQVKGLDITGRCIPANHVGGDFFQYFERDGKLAICMADVTGHAMEAAVPVMMFSGVLKNEMRHGSSIDTLFTNLNEAMHEALDKRTYVCFEMMELDLTDRRLQLANSGCPYPFHYHDSTGDVTELQVDAYPLGVRAETTYSAIETNLEMGDYIVFCSDGIIEAQNDLEEMFGFERTEATIQMACTEGLSAEALIDRLIGKVQEFTGDEPQGDDMTCVALRSEKIGESI